MTRLGSVTANGERRINRRPANDHAAPADYASALKLSPVRDGAWTIGRDGRRRLDLCNAAGRVVIGWNDPHIEAAAAEAAAGLHGRLAGRLSEMTPGADAVAFEATVASAMAAVLLAAKTTTGRDGAYFCDEAVSASGDLEGLAETLDRRGGEMAALVIRPLDASPAFLKAVRRLSDRHGVVLVFEESRSALRVHRGGAQGLSGVTADAVVFGPSLANGRELAAVTGRIELMSAISRQGPAPDPAAVGAALAVLDRAEREDLAHRLQIIGAEIAAELEQRLVRTGADAFAGVYGDPSWSVVAGDPAFEAALSDALAQEGVLSFGAHTPSAACGPSEVAYLLAAYDRALPRAVERARWSGLRAG
ncbi:aminotransferase class III-fold pyridoxal phosphate-dependent enzyme [Brevundimonas sp.]|uniref:aminotransferase class III-fold pyridoxal phosphate-dependent enzyme n=1 Tax=Brevundimonas sp. TaxID=1871086 RepID=UPI0025D2DE75|nr:aminotransferase class III-fold pyridoxal phosphate-dependent enzyme [Brevundimonas sp.]